MRSVAKCAQREVPGRTRPLIRSTVRTLCLFRVQVNIIVSTNLNSTSSTTRLTNTRQQDDKRGLGENVVLDLMNNKNLTTLYLSPYFSTGLR